MTKTNGWEFAGERGGNYEDGLYSSEWTLSANDWLGPTINTWIEAEWLGIPEDIEISTVSKEKTENIINAMPQRPLTKCTVTWLND